MQQIERELKGRVGDPLSAAWAFTDTDDVAIPVAAARLEVYDREDDAPLLAFTDADDALTVSHNEVGFEVAWEDLVGEGGDPLEATLRWLPYRYRLQVDILSHGLDTLVVGDLEIVEAASEAQGDAGTVQGVIDAGEEVVEVEVAAKSVLIKYEAASHFVGRPPAGETLFHWVSRNNYTVEDVVVRAETPPAADFDVTISMDNFSGVLTLPAGEQVATLDIGAALPVGGVLKATAGDARDASVADLSISFGLAT